MKMNLKKLEVNIIFSCQCKLSQENGKKGYNKLPLNLFLV